MVTTGLGLRGYYVKWSGAACLAHQPAIEAAAGPPSAGWGVCVCVGGDCRGGVWPESGGLEGTHTELIGPI